MKTTTLNAVVLSLLLAAVTGSAQAADNKAIIKHRQAVMQAIGGHFGAAFSSMRGMQEFDGNQVFHAESVARLSKIAVDTFPAGSGEGKTKALAEVWDKPEGFSKAMDEFLMKAQAFSTAAKAKDISAYGAAAKALGKTCKGCHDDFKEK